MERVIIQVSRFRKLDENGANNNFVSILKLDNIQDQPQMPEQVYLSFTVVLEARRIIIGLRTCQFANSGSPNEQDVHHYQLAFAKMQFYATVPK